MTPPSQIETRPYKTKTPSKRGRKSYTTPDVIDVTGKTHFMVVRRLQNNKKQKKKCNECKNCEQSDEYVDILEERVNTLESQVNNLQKVTNERPTTRNSVTTNEFNCYAQLEMDGILRVANSIGDIIQGRIQTSQQGSPTTIDEFINENIIAELWNVPGRNDFN
ncbi:10530_t:CDS:1 [Funneliformis geosporum]|uniref:4829_t:CDS:1 n=1 Tax=Funneliformis geosporum TaxID=1117311 RepID=A0A9W4WQK9_9GLOM|nr:4829_t:CDS:1 [Funneliformis geosporum]CAI2169795.1 10530_t:CDS:1 [Funneliformis geosporum]